ncbi:hypothetical protein AnigIFM60653_009921 [Aspergillus niger]|nr:hypothetical protein AnigIFM60653_009921 [Aspergillus niger]GLA19268.1 hypothetical protein AnigIFM62618_006937 [Aspergillus niger]
MAPYIQEAVGTDSASQAILDSENLVLNHDHVQKPVADDFMYDFKYNHSLPTTTMLGVKIPINCDIQKEAEGIITRLSTN